MVHRQELIFEAVETAGELTGGARVGNVDTLTMGPSVACAPGFFLILQPACARINSATSGIAVRLTRSVSAARDLNQAIVERGPSADIGQAVRGKCVHAASVF